MILLPVIGVLLAETPAIAGTSVDSRSTATKEQPAIHEGNTTGGERKATGTVTPDSLGVAIQKYLENEWKQKVATVSVTVLEPADSVATVAGAVSLRVIPSTTEDGPGRRMFRVAVTNGKSARTIPVIADVTMMVDAVVPNRFLKADELIEVGDIRITRIRVYQVNHPFITNESEVVGMSAVRPLPPDVPLRAAFVRLPLVVKKGDRVLIEAQRGGLSIRAYGITKSSGQVGQTIRVANLDSGRELTAKVVGPSLVRVEF